MDNDFDLDNILDSMNLTGQWQPSSMPDIEDPSLNIQILDDINFSADDSPPLPILNNNDDISNALMDPLETDNITQLLSTSFGELPRQNTIEETMENMNLNQSQTDILSSSICVQMGSSPVEQKEIENSILVNQVVRNQRRMLKNAPKSKRNSGSQQPSSTVGPVDILSSYGACKPCATVQMQSDFDYSQQFLRYDSMESKQIQIISQPRSNFRPRTQNESKIASHYIRCEANNQYEYPTIYLHREWARQSIKNIIEITLVAKDKQPHNYGIDNKSCKSTFEDDALIFRQNDPHTLYFCLTDDDFNKGYKSFMIEYIKSKQEGNITKDLIKTRQLEQSMLRFTRIYQDDKNTFQRDDNSVEYSCIMTEAYGDISVEHMGPKFGPMGGNELVYTLLKRRVAKDDLNVIISEDITGWRQQVSITTNGNLVYFSMPAFPYSQYDRAVTNITLYYKGEELYQSTYLYKGGLDQELAALNLNDSNNNNNNSNNNNDPPSTSNTFNAFDFFASTGVRPTTNSSRKSSTTKRTKRLSNNK